MCGRYALHANPEVIALQFGLADIPDFKASYNICPGTDVLIIGMNGTAHRCRWGSRPANARGETVAEKPAFREAFRRWRCLVPASGFYEWQAVAGKKHPWYVRPQDAGLFGLAGITALWNGMRAVSLITTEPNDLMRPIHERMPVIIQPGDYADWLDGKNRDIPALKGFLRPYPAERMAAYPVSLRVNTPANDDPALIAAI